MRRRVILNHEINKGFRARLEQGGAMLLPGVVNALAARVIEDQGFEALYLVRRHMIWDTRA